MRRWLFVYDVSDDDARIHLAETLLGFGLDRVQKSAFEGFLDSREMARLSASIATDVGLIGAKIAAYPLDDRSGKRRFTLGAQAAAEKIQAYWIV